MSDDKSDKVESGMLTDDVKNESGEHADEVAGSSMDDTCDAKDSADIKHFDVDGKVSEWWAGVMEVVSMVYEVMNE